MTIAIGRIHTLKAPLLDGTYGSGAPTAVFGPAPTNPNMIGYQKAVSGLESPTVRRTSDKVVGGDGEIPGPASHGPRPVTISGLVYPPDWGAAHEGAQRRLELVTNLIMNADGELSWSEGDGLARYLYVRCEQEPRFTSEFPKEFFCGLVAYQPRIFGVETQSAVTGPGTNLISITNAGTKDSPPRIRIDGPQNSSTFQIERRYGGGAPFSGVELKLGTSTVSAVIPSGTYWTVDFLHRTITATTGSTTVSKDGAVDPSGEWWTLPPSAVIGGGPWQLYLADTSGAWTWRTWTRNAW